MDLVCVYKYSFEKAGTAASSLVVAKQSSKSHLIHQEVHTYWAPEFRQRALLICEKAITFFVSLQMLELKKATMDQVLKVYDPSVKQIDMLAVQAQITRIFNENIFEMQPQKEADVESIFDEQPDLVSQMVQKSIKLFFRDFGELLLCLVDKVHGVTAYNEMLTGDAQAIAANGEIGPEE